MKICDSGIWTVIMEIYKELRYNFTVKQVSQNFV